VQSDSQVLTCDSCQRILYFIPVPEPAPESTPVAESATAEARQR
jgi:hypothetical protein